MSYTITLANDDDILFDEFKAFIVRHEQQFFPPLSGRVDLDTYCDKLWREARNLVAIESGQRRIVGVCSFYCTPGQYDTSFLTLIVVDANQQKKRIGRAMIKKWAEYAKSAGMSSLETKTWDQNEKMKRLLELFGFRQTYASAEIKGRTTLNYSVDLLKPGFDDQVCADRME